MPRPLTIEERIANLERQLRQRPSPFVGTGMHPNGVGGLDSDGFVHGSTGYRLAETPEFNNLVLRGGIIGNDALTNPSAPYAVYDYAQNFTVPTTLANVKTVTVPVPAGFTSASVQLTVRCYAINSTAGLDYLFSQANINGFNGWALPMPASGSGGSCLNVSTFALVLTGLGSGSNVTLQAAVGASFGAWAANTQNTADIAASITWYR